MLDIVFAVSVLAAVLFFGALISMGNERQRKAIDGLREQAVRWSEADLRLKRVRALHSFRSQEPMEWLDGVVTRLLGTSPTLISLSSWQQNDTQALLGLCQDGRHLVVTPIPVERFIKAIRSKSHSRLQKAEVGILGDHPRRIPVYEMNIVTAGEFFDMEATICWEKVTGKRMEIERLFLFEVPPMRKAR